MKETTGDVCPHRIRISRSFPLENFNVIDTRTGEIMDVGDERDVGKLLSSIDLDRTRGRKVLVNVLLY